MTRTIPHVAILVETSREYGRGLLRGIAQYNKEHEPWSMYFEPKGLGDPPPRWLSHWSGDGIIARISDHGIAKKIEETGLPVVDLCNTVSEMQVPRIIPDNYAIAKMAYEHLLERGFRHFGFFSSFRGKCWFIDERCEYFNKFVKENGYTHHIFDFRNRRQQSLNWEQEQEQIAESLNQLPKPVGIMTGNDDMGQRVLDACLRVNAMVPDEIAVISVDNDEYLCNLSNPPISSIDVNQELIGYKAAALLDKMMNGEETGKYFLELPPKCVVVRQSTDVLATNNVEFISALRYIREHACDPISVEQVLKSQALSRSSLERLFRRELGRTPKEEIQRIQITKAKDLLAHSDLALSIIAEKSGFSSFSHFSTTFKKQVGAIPSEYRKQFKPFNFS